MRFLTFTFFVIILIALAVGISCLGLGTLAGFLDATEFGTKALFIDLFSHFRMQYLIAQILVLVPLFLFYRVKNRFLTVTATLLIGLNLIFCFLNASQILPYYLPQSKDGPFVARLRIFHLNVLGKNQLSQPTLNAIQAANADIVSLQEYNTRWRNTLEASSVMKAYPYRFHVPWGDDAVYSKLPFSKVRVEKIPGSSFGADVSLVADLHLGGKPVTLVFSHPPTPIRKDLYPRQQQHFKFWAKNHKAHQHNLIIAGDLNTTPWSSSLRNLMRATGLRDSQLGFGIQPSFNVNDRWRQIPIDHFLVSKNFIVLNRQLGPDVHSDHYPVIIDLGLRE